MHREGKAQHWLTNFPPRLPITSHVQGGASGPHSAVKTASGLPRSRSITSTENKGNVATRVASTTSEVMPKSKSERHEASDRSSFGSSVVGAGGAVAAWAITGAPCTGRTRGP